MKAQTGYINSLRAMTFTAPQPDRKRIYVNFEGRDPVEVMSMQGAWAIVKANPQWELESIEEWEA